MSFVCEEGIAADTFNPKIFAKYATIDTSHFWFSARSSLIVDLVGRHFSKATSMLEIGCGTAAVLQAMKGAYPAMALSGSDLSVEGLRYSSSKKLGANLYRMDATEIPFTEHFDIIGAFDVLEHIEDDRLVLRELYRACNPGGGVILAVPQHRWLWSPTDEYAGHVRRYTRRELVTKVEQAGFQVERVTSFVSLLLPLMLLSRLKQRLMPLQKEIDEGFFISPGINRILRYVLSFEQFLISRDMSLPIGGSLFVVARKKPQPTNSAKIDV
ncbi:class I SAM-dependent methyltransferase [Herbaspirillum aquaticum]|uniref:class I SAM-dependent methyltransferase n=1 Tax=Herbaspirillum aquaticum TaxID=568783 RepID=UPI001302FDDD|nr:class I SAM-dependent methyltransferase [Herbaspirillum aquaticum]